MPLVINITNEEIQAAETILLPAGKAFNDERVNFIKDFRTLDLQAVPGSGKTTALLAKLLILEKKLPFNDGSGILILSHTNAAIDEIRHKIEGHCPKLFKYPNFIGTIQTFVDEFLAIPYYIQKFNKKPVRIDNEIFEEIAEGYYRSMPNNAAKNWLGRQHEPESIMRKLVFDIDGNLKKGIDGNILLRRNSNSDSYKQLCGIKTKILKSGFLNYDDAYLLAEVYLRDLPQIKNIIQKRFSFVFVDEMQDMDTHQYDLLEKLFYDGGNASSILQRIGDRNQAIYSTIKASDIWQDRATILKLSESMRLNGPISKAVSNFALYRGNNFNVVGVSEGNLKPHLLVYTNATLANVIPYFSNLVTDYKNANQLLNFENYPVKVVAWNTEWKEQAEIDDITKIRLTDYYKNYSRSIAKPKNDYSYLRNYLLYYDKNKLTLESLRKNILNAFLKVLRLENIYYDADKTYTKKVLLAFLRDVESDIYEEFKLHIYNWSIGVIKGNIEEVIIEIREYIPTFFAIFSDVPLANSLPFINEEVINIAIVEEVENNKNPNIFHANDVSIEVASVHSVKGQTHCATLYLESYYYKDGNGANAKSYESQRLAGQFLGIPINAANVTKRVKESTKMAFVGFSRPTDLLCVAIHKNHFDSAVSTINRDDWEVFEVPVPA